MTDSGGSSDPPDPGAHGGTKMAVETRNGERRICTRFATRRHTAYTSKAQEMNE